MHRRSRYRLQLARRADSASDGARVSAGDQQILAVDSTQNANAWETLDLQTFVARPGGGLIMKKTRRGRWAQALGPLQRKNQFRPKSMLLASGGPQFGRKRRIRTV